MGIPEEHIQLIQETFRGRTDVFARRWEKDGRSGYSPAYAFSWEEFAAHRRKGGTFKDFQNKKLVPLTPEIIRRHLLGFEFIGIYPILPDNTSWFVAADFDGERSLADGRSYLAECARFGLQGYVERSRSGAGIHVWLFFEEPLLCSLTRRVCLELIRRAEGISEFQHESRFDRLFPNQDALPVGGFGNLIALPLHGKSVAQQRTVFIDSGSGLPFDDQWNALASVRRHTKADFQAASSLLFGEAQHSQYHSGTNSSVLTIAVGKDIQLRRAQLSQEVVSFLKGELNLLNVEYVIKRRMGTSTYNVNRFFTLVEEKDGIVHIPRGFRDNLTSFLTERRIDHKVVADHPALAPVVFSSAINVTPAQADVIDAGLSHDQGVIVAPAGSGKTIIGLELIARRRLPALVLVHRRQLLDQWSDRIQSFLSIPKTKIGQFSGTKKSVGDAVTVALVQSLARRKDVAELARLFGTIVVDECHHVPAKTFRAVVSQFNPTFLYGLTATPKRKNSDEKLIYAYIGDIIARLDAIPTRDDVPIPSSPLRVMVRETSLRVPFKFSADRFELLARTICFDTARNAMIVQDITSQTNLGRKVLVLSERAEHVEILRLHLKGKAEMIAVTGEDSLRSRASKFKQIEGGHFSVILSTGQFFGEGLDVGGINCLVLAFPFSFEGKLAQYIGRLRESGTERVIIDYRDKEIPFLEKQFKKRARFYKKLLGNQRLGGG